jgi:hypothetical protein
MKKILILILIILSVQCYGQRKLSFGVRAGYGYSNIPLERLKPSFQLGISGEYKVIKALFLQAEVIYTNEGFRETGFIPQNNGNLLIIPNLNINFNYIQIPIQAKLKIGTTIKPYYMLGIAPSFFISESTNNEFVAHLIKENPATNINTINANLYNTLGVELAKWRIRPFIDFRYSQGLVSTSKNSNGYLNKQFILTTGITF